MQAGDKMEAALARQIFSCARGFGDHRSARREKRSGSVAQPTGAPRHIHAFDRRELRQRAGDVAPVFRRCAGDVMWINQLPPLSREAFPFRVAAREIHRQLKACVGHAHWKIDILLERELLRQVEELTVHLHASAPIPLADCGEFHDARSRCDLE